MVKVIVSFHMILSRTWAIRVATFQQMCYAHDDNLIKVLIVHMVLPIVVM